MQRHRRRLRVSGKEGSRGVLLVGMFGCGNLGNEASLSVVVDALRSRRADVPLMVLGDQPHEITRLHGLAAAPMHWTPTGNWPVPGPAINLFAKMVDGVRIGAYVRGRSAVIVPGTGIFEALGVVAWRIPWILFVTALWGRIHGVPVAFVDVGAEPIADRPSRLLFSWAVRLATHVSVRDEYSRASLKTMGADASTISVVGDLVFADPPFPGGTTTKPATVAVGVMAWYGERDRPDSDGGAHERYVNSMVRFVAHLLGSHYRVMLVTGDQADTATAQAILRRVADAAQCDGIATVCPTDDLRGLASAFASASVVVATRYHNVVTSLQSGKPVVSIGYAAKNTELLAEFGLAHFAQEIEELDVDRLIEQFNSAISDEGTIVPRIREGRRRVRLRVQTELIDLVAELLPDGPPPTESVAPPREAQVVPSAQPAHLAVSQVPRVSIGIPVWNGQRYLQAALESVRLQTYRDIDIVVSDNGSTDDTEGICRAAAASDSRIRYFRSATNNGGSWNYNRVLELTNAEFFMWTAADDVLLPSYVERCVDALDAAGDRAAIACPRTQLIDACGTVFEDLNDAGLHLTQPSAHQRVGTMLHAQASHLMYGLIRRSALDRTRGVLPVIGDDVVLLTELLCRGQLLLINDKLFHQRRHAEQFSAQGQNQVKWFAPDRAAIFAFPQTRTNLALCSAVWTSPLPLSEKALTVASVMSNWTLPRWRALGSDIKDALKLA